MNNQHHHSRQKFNNLTRHDMNNKHHHSRAESSTISLEMICIINIIIVVHKVQQSHYT